MSALTISNGGTAWIRDMEAQGKAPVGGSDTSPNAAYYRELDAEQAQAAQPATPLPASMTDLLRQRAAADGMDGSAADSIAQQLKTFASSHALPASGNIIDVTA